MFGSGNSGSQTHTIDDIELVLDDGECPTGCSDNGDCTDPGLPYCETVSGDCVECLNNGHCDDSNVCTDDTCDVGGTYTCSNTNNTASCDDGAFCNGTDTCSGGVCTHSGDPCAGGAECNTTCNEGPDNCFDAAGTGCTDDGNDCTSDECNGSGTCTHPSVPDDDPCDDGVFCNGADTCFSGVCSQHAGDPCAGGAECNTTCNEGPDNCFDAAGTGCTDDGNVCTDDECNGSGTCTHPNNTDPCDDGDACNVGEACSGGSCVGGSPVDCSGASDLCKTASCDSGGSEGNCDTITPINEGGSCDDTLYCNGTDTCSGGTCVHSGDPCLPQVCDEGGDTCVDCLVDGDCDDGDACNGAETCVTNACVPGTPLDCSYLDGDCVQGICDSGLGCIAESIDRLDFETNSESQYMRIGDNGQVTMEMHCLDGSYRDSGLVNGVQVRFNYNAAIVSLDDITLGDGQGSPWDGGQEVYFDDDAGDVTWAIILPGVGNCTMQDSVIGTLHFTGIAEGTTQVTLRPDDPPRVSQFADCVTNDGYPITAFSLDLAIVVDNTEPDLAITEITPDPAMAGTVYITVTASDDDAGLDGDPVVTVTPNGGGAETATFVDENPTGTFNYTFVVEAGDPCGAATVQASVDDLSGNNATTSDTFTIDADDPTLNIASIVPDPAGLGAVVIAVTASDGCTSLADNPTVEVTPNGGSATPAVFNNELPPGTFNYTFTVTGATPEGAAIVDASVTDAAGNTAVDADTFLIDISGPTIDITAITQDGDNVMLSAAPPVRDAYQGTVDILVTADDGGGAGFAGNPDVDVTDAGSTTLPATFVIESPSGTFQYTYSVVAGTANGTATVDAEVTDLALNTANATAEEFLVNHNQITVDVQLEGLTNAKTRTVTFVVSDCTGAGSAVTINKAVSFSAFGFGVAYLTGADGIRADLGTFDISAKEDHVVRRMLSGQSMGGGTPTVQFISAVGAELLAGDFTGDNFVDVLDFSVLAMYFNTVNTRADVDGSGLTDSADFSAIVANFFVHGDTRSTCDLTQPLSGSRCLARSVSVQSLSADAAFAADLTGDGVVDVSDVKTFAKLYNIRLSREASRHMSRLAQQSPHGPAALTTDPLEDGQR